MAEGPVVHRYVQRLKRALEGQTTDVEFGTGSLKPLEPSLTQVRTSLVEAHGKQTRLHFSDGRVILVHLLMWGSWRIYRKGAQWDKPRKMARLILRTGTHEAVAFSAPVVKVFTEDALEKDRTWGTLGPDPLRRDFSVEEFRRLLRHEGDREIGEVLLDQRVVAGVGNILRVEILFSSRVDPRMRVRDLSAHDVDEILYWTLKLMHQWLGSSAENQGWRHIHRRSGHPCPVCGWAIVFFRQAGRITYVCPRCQNSEIFIPA